MDTLLRRTNILQTETLFFLLFLTMLHSMTIVYVLFLFLDELLLANVVYI